MAVVKKMLTQIVDRIFTRFAVIAVDADRVSFLVSYRRDDTSAVGELTTGSGLRFVRFLIQLENAPRAFAETQT
jgi:hypothetical protein